MVIRANAHGLLMREEKYVAAAANPEIHPGVWKEPATDQIN